MPKVSVLVAVYQAETFLPQCLDSLSRQTLTDFEVICVDDGSTDGSARVLDDFASRDARFKVIRLQENQGQAHARNVALQEAHGDFVCMLDADDWLAPDALALAVEAFDEETDAVLFKVVNHDSDGREENYPMIPFQSISGEKAFQLSLSWKIHGVYMIRADIHRRIPYDETCRAYSDDNTTRLHYLSSRQVRCCEGRYFYRQHPASVTHAVSVRRFDYLKANESMRMQLLKQRPDMLGIYENLRWLNLIDVYMFYHVHGSELSDEDRAYGLGELHRVWGGIDRSLLDKKTIAKFGYRPCKSWRMFRLQEWAYFIIRGWFGKNR